MANVASAGNSGKRLWQKLGLKDGTRLYVAEAPATWPRLMTGAPQGVVPLSRLGCAIDATWSGLKLVRRRALSRHAVIRS